MSDHTDRTPTEEQQDGRQDADRPDVTRQDATVGVVEAAQLLGVTTDAVRARLRRGTLQGHKVEGEWLVSVPGALSDRQDPTGSQQDATVGRRDATEHRQDEPTERDRTPTVDLAPLVSHIATLEDQVQRLAESNTMWQIRARQAEEQLKQLTAGNGAPDNAPEPNTVDAEGPQLLQERNPAPTGVLAWWKRFWRHLEGA